MATNMDDVRTILDEGSATYVEFTDRRVFVMYHDESDDGAPIYIDIKQDGERVHVKAMGLKQFRSPEAVLGHLNKFNANETMVRAMIDPDYGGLKLDVVIEVGPGPLDPEVLFVSCAALHHGAKRLVSELDIMMLRYSNDALQRPKKRGCFLSIGFGFRQWVAMLKQGWHLNA